MQLANQEAQRLNHEYIGTEHILLGLVKEGSGVAATVLRNLDIDLRKIRLEIVRIVQSGPDMVTMGRLPLTPWAKEVIEYSIEEARNFNHPYVGTEHLLLGLLRKQESVAAQVLMNLDLRLEEVGEELLRLLGPTPPSRFQRCARRLGYWLHGHPHLGLFLSGLLITLAGAGVDCGLFGSEDPDRGAVIAGGAFVAAVALQTLISRSRQSC
jgi:hypothetical protein